MKAEYVEFLTNLAHALEGRGEVTVEVLLTLREISEAITMDNQRFAIARDARPVAADGSDVKRAVNGGAIVIAKAIDEDVAREIAYVFTLRDLLLREQKEIARIFSCPDSEEIRTPSNLPNLVRDLLTEKLTLDQAIERSGFDVAPCTLCSYPVVCLPDGLPSCEDCARKEGDQQ